ncbi:PACE efflux transporter [Aquirhabdus parva]|uniref:Chlorhexidine efflux transporter domain-containing protein n=1 Tax=Aquirhabdus parva TaxID=2283318 RepID=A0A345P3B6_9GAMM|nr:PACE efflux transporter [Aquirhabdus parva]AXI01775.1 hypothetical protein HYN46_02095 [Aquirhabdus parva]
MQGLKRRIIHTALFESIAVVLFIMIAALFFHEDKAHLGALAILLSLIAMGWNLLFNKLFERWEARQKSQIRTLKRRILHAFGFEAGLMTVSLPLLAWTLNIGLWEALITDIAFMLFYLVYGLVFNWGFDRIFGLPKLKIVKRTKTRTA